MRQFIALVAVVGGLSAYLPAGAATFSPSGDAAGDEVRAAVRSMLRAAADGDADAARKAFAGPPAQAELVAAWARASRAALTLDASARRQFGNDTPQRLLTVVTALRAGGDGVLALPLSMNGREAYVGAGGLKEPHYRLARVGGRWQVTAIEFDNEALLTSKVRVMQAVAASMEKLERKVEAKQLADVAALVRAFEQMGDELLPVFSASERAVMEARPLRRATPVGPRERQAALESIPGVLVSAAIGKPAGSPEVRELMAAMPGTPRVDLFEDGMFVSSEEGGLDLKFTDPTGRALECVFAFPKGDGDHDAYPGGLPAGLAGDMTRAQVEARLGRPDETSGTDGNLEAVYVRRGIVLLYKGRSGRDPSAVISRVLVTMPLPRPGGDEVVRVTIRATARPGTPEAAKAERVHVDGPEGEPLLVLPNDVATAEDIADVRLDAPAAGEGGSPYVVVALAPAAAARLAAAYGPVPEGERPRVAVFLNDRCFRAIAVSKLREGVFLIGGSEPAVSARLAGVLHATANQLPPARPATGPATRPERVVERAK